MRAACSVSSAVHLDAQLREQHWDPLTCARFHKTLPLPSTQGWADWKLIYQHNCQSSMTDSKMVCPRYCTTACCGEHDSIIP